LVEPSEAKWQMIGGRPVLFAAVANGVPALVLVVDDRVAAVVSLDVTAEGIAAVHTQANPSKLERATRQWATSEHGEPLVDNW
jgi:RNA polymerase sigma-70 factor (ECF subfamily)